MKKILVVDDEEMMLRIISEQLERDQFSVVTCTDSREVMDIIAKEQPDMLISDIMMPYMSGLELLSIIKTELVNRIPVILISSLDQMEVIQTAVDLGADDFIIKPLQTDELSLRVKRLFMLAE